MTQVITVGTDTTTLILNGRALSAFAAGDIMTLTPEADKTSQVNGSNGGVSISARADADVYTLMFRLMRYSEDDVFMNAAMNTPTPTIFQGSMKQDYTRDGATFKESWSLENGSITAAPTMTYNDTDGNAVTEYTVKFRTAKRSI